MNKPFNHFLGLVESLKPNAPKWPRLYSTTIIDRAVMTEAQREELWTEYREYWKGHEGHSNRTEQDDCQRDHDDERDGVSR